MASFWTFLYMATTREKDHTPFNYTDINGEDGEGEAKTKDWLQAAQIVSSVIV